MIDPNNLNQRYVITPEGRGWLMGLNEKDTSATTATVQFPAEGKTPGRMKCFDVSELEEVEDG